ncbi:MAG: biotin--[acetyl-CoA-carboxylase] ligase, partial [Sphingomicrobium sp.]
MTRIRIVETAGSTNADLIADTRAVEGDWQVALEQTAGRGRQGRRWVGMAGNFFGSTLVELRADDPPPQSLSLVAGLALIEALDSAASDRALMLKWPNDLLSDGAKAAGILLERQGERVVAGFGVNLAHAPEVGERRTTGLGAVVAPTAFASLLAASFARILASWRASDPMQFAQAWMARAHPLGAPLAVHDESGGRISGTFDGIEGDGSLRLRLADGTIRAVRAG